MQFIIGKPEILQAVREYLAAKGYRVDERTPYMADKPIQQAANEYAERAIGSIKEMLDALDHAQKCTGKMECGQCDGFGQLDAVDSPSHQNEECPVCNGKGMIPCNAGEGSDEPEAWHDEERAMTRIDEDPLCIQIRSGWHSIGEDDQKAAGEYYILITTGGPAARIIGDYEDGQATSARFQYQDWFQPWTEAQTTVEQDHILLQYAQRFTYGGL